MIITVTLNPALDKTLAVPSFALGEVNRAAEVRIDPGGKGVNVAKVLKAFGCKALATGFLGGSAGRSIAEALTKMGIPHDFIFTRGETRTNLKIADPVLHTHTDVNEPGDELDEDDVAALRQKLLSLAQRGDIVLFAGSSPRGVRDDVPAQTARMLKERGVKVAADLDRGRLKAMLAEKPFFIKPNERELKELLSLPDTEVETLAMAARRLVESGIAHVLVSRGEKGALFADEKGVLQGHAQRVEAVSTVGAGDAMTAGYLYALERSFTREQAARFALAVSTAKVLCPGSSPPSKAAAEEMLERIELAEYGA